MPLFYGKKLAAIGQRPQAVTQLKLAEGLLEKCTQISSSSQLLLLCLVHMVRRGCWCWHLSSVHVGIPGLQAAAMLLRIHWWKNTVFVKE